MFRGGASIGWRCAVITGMYSLGSCTCDVVRNHIQPLDHAAVGFGAAALYKTLGGPKYYLLNIRHFVTNTYIAPNQQTLN